MTSTPPERAAPSAAVDEPARPAREHRSRWLRGLFIVAGTICVGLGMLGLFLPLLPTTPLLLLAAACYARGSQRFYNWLLANRTFGPLIHEWHQHRAIPYRTKLSAIALMLLTLGVSITLFVEPAWLKLLLAVLGLSLAIWMYRLPSRDRPGRRARAATSK